MTEVKPILDRLERLEGGRGTWEDHWQDVAEIMLPQRADFTTTRVPGEKRLEKVFDGTPLLAVRGMAAAIDSMVKPKTSRWFSIKPVDDELGDNDEVKAWLEQVEKITFDAIYDRRAGFIQRSGEVDSDLAAFGTGALFITENRTLDGLLFRSVPLTSFFIDENSDGAVDTLFMKMKLSARQAVQRWGRDKLGDETRKALENNKPEERFEFVHLVEPRAEREPGMDDNLNLPFASITIDKKAEKVVDEGGFHEFPFAIPRWDTRSGELYGWGPGMLALPDALTLQAQAKTVLKGGQMVVEPPLIVPNDGIVKSAQLFPRGVISYDAAKAAKLGKNKPVDKLDISGDIPIGRDMQQDSREQVFAAFFRNVLNLPVDGPQMTATEIIERKEEFARTVGPVFGRLENEYVGPVAERVFAILLRMGRFPVPPRIIQGREIRFEYANPIDKVRKQIDALAAGRTVEMLGPFVAADPSVMDNFDADEIARDTGEFNGMPQKWIRKTEERDAIRQQRLDEAEAARDEASAIRLAETTAKVAQAAPQQ